VLEIPGAIGIDDPIPVGAARRHDPPLDQLVARCDAVGHPITGDRRLGRSLHVFVTRGPSGHSGSYLPGLHRPA
jgi:hypothetical protein